VACVSAKRCSVCNGVGGEVRGTKARGEKAAMAVRGESGRRLREGGVLPYLPSASGLVWALKRGM
jgi:hypothetical protein